jgi:enoyl-CoA hydratase/carnithine racemase
MRPQDFDAYKDRYETATLERTDEGVLTVTIHEPGHPDQPINYGARPIDWHAPLVEWSYLFQDISRDLENEVVIVTGAGNQFTGHHRLAHVAGHEGVFVPDDETGAAVVGKVPPVDIHDWEWIQSAVAQMQLNILNIECPVIGAVNGPALSHADLVVQSDIVICTPETVFGDQPHFESGMFAPGDSVALIWPEMLGVNRGRYFLLTGQRIPAKEALDLGVVSEIVQRENLLPRANELAAMILERPRLVRRYARQIMVHGQRMKMLDHIGYGLALEGLTVMGRRLNP